MVKISFVRVNFARVDKKLNDFVQNYKIKKEHTLLATDNNSGNNFYCS